MSSSVKFHWALPVDAKPNGKEAQRDTSGQIDIERLVQFVRLADESPIDSLLTPFGFHMPDPFPLLGMLSSHTKRIKFLLAYRPGLMSPTLFAQQMNTLSQLLPHRLDLNVVAGFSPEEQAYYGDHLSHDDRYARSSEFMSIVNALWNDHSPVSKSGQYYNVKEARLNTSFIGGKPKVYLSGNSKIAQSQAANGIDCWLRYADTPESIKPAVDIFRAHSDMNVGLRLSIVSGKTRAEALDRAAQVVHNPDLKWKSFLKEFVLRSDSSAVKNTFGLSERAEWLDDFLWTGAVPYRGGPAMAIVGSYAEVAAYLNKFIDAGVKEFILSGWPTDEELIRFSTDIYSKI